VECTVGRRPFSVELASIVFEILVVDDNPIDRHLVGRLLGKQPDWRIHFANDGAAAITSIGDVRPHLIVTDMQMPYIDGLALVQSVRCNYPEIPVVLITSYGTEKTAVEALKHGAASYSPKTALQKDLVRTVRQVLEMSQHVNAPLVPANQPIPKNMAFVLDNDLALIGPLIEQLQAALPSWSDRDRLQIGMAIDEALVNAMHHGNLEVDTNLRDIDEATYNHEIDSRRLRPPFCDRKVRIQAEFSESHVCVQISDDGQGFDPAQVPDPTTPENLRNVGGRGLFLINAFMSKVVHNSIGNQITMTKLRAQETCRI
jgi:CheY-like chemotaxis protein